MPFKQYREDRKEILKSWPPDITEIKSGDENELTFKCHFALNDVPKAVKIQLLPADVDEYPEGNSWFLCCLIDNVSDEIPPHLEAISTLR